MNIKIKSKEKLRKEIEERLKKAPEGAKVFLDKRILEDLLFETITINSEQGIKVKLPVWSGPFLSKLDLSEIDFEDVSWNLASLDSFERYFEDDYEVNFYGIQMDDEKAIIREIDDINVPVVDYENTNAHIDLTKSFECKHGKEIAVSDCNFTGVDLSGNDLSKADRIWFDNTSLKETNIVLPNIKDIFAYNSDLSGLNLSGFTINGNTNICGKPRDFGHCNLNGTGVNIEFNPEYMPESHKYSPKAKRRIVHSIDKAIRNNWNGCKLNGEMLEDFEHMSPEKVSELVDFLTNSFMPKEKEIN